MTKHSDIELDEFHDLGPFQWMLRVEINEDGDDCLVLTTYISTELVAFDSVEIKRDSCDKIIRSYVYGMVRAQMAEWDAELSKFAMETKDMK